MQMDLQADLFRLCADVREFLAPVWVRWRQSRGEPVLATPSTNTCGRSSLFLRDVLRSEGFSAEWTSGVPRLAEEGADIGPFGFFSGRRWESHAWVVSNNFILDITADQFGAAPVIVTPIVDDRYRAGYKDTAMPSARRARQEAVEALWPEWLSHRAISPGLQDI